MPHKQPYWMRRRNRAIVRQYRRLAKKDRKSAVRKTSYLFDSLTPQSIRRILKQEGAWSR
jgi:hypothetical protein